MQTAIRLTASKVMAFILVGCSVLLDILNGGATAFMFTVPFVSALVLGKQYFDSRGNIVPTNTTNAQQS